MCVFYIYIMPLILTSAFSMFTNAFNYPLFYISVTTQKLHRKTIPESFLCVPKSSMYYFHLKFIHLTNVDIKFIVFHCSKFYTTQYLITLLFSSIYLFISDVAAKEISDTTLTPEAPTRNVSGSPIISETIFMAAKQTHHSFMIGHACYSLCDLITIF
ncbi:unnamed protein product [Malus baccata var. baccata]